jgi:hypothetical protein
VLESIPHDISRLHRREWRRARLEEANSLPKWRSTSHFIQWMIPSPCFLFIIVIVNDNDA